MKHFFKFGTTTQQRVLILSITVIIGCILLLISLIPNYQESEFEIAKERLPDFTKFSLEELKEVEIISIPKSSVQSECVVSMGLLITLIPLVLLNK